MLVTDVADGDARAALLEEAGHLTADGADALEEHVLAGEVREP